MKTTGIIRRIDDLGRVVVPKKIRRTFNIKEGDPLEIIISDNMVCYKKYIPETNYIDIINSMIQTLSDDCDINNNTKSILDSKLKEAIEILKKDNTNL